jgi:hypothetical protein
VVSVGSRSSSADLVDAALVAPALELGGEERVYDLAGYILGR